MFTQVSLVLFVALGSTLTYYSFVKDLEDITNFLVSIALIELSFLFSIFMRQSFGKPLTPSPSDILKPESVVLCTIYVLIPFVSAAIFNILSENVFSKNSTFQAISRNSANETAIYVVAFVVVTLVYFLLLRTIFKTYGITIVFMSIILFVVSFVTIFTLYFVGHPHHAFVTYLLSFVVMLPYDFLGAISTSILYGIALHGFAMFGVFDSFKIVK
jgi:hypothetical protein